MLTIPFRRAVLFVVSAAVALASAGCLDMERALTLNKDLSGRAGLRMSMDLEAIVPLMLKVQHQSEGKTDPPTEAEIAATKAQLLAITAMMPATGIFEATKIAAGLPEGMTVVESTQKMEGTKLTFNIVIGFKDVTKVPLIAIAPPGTPQTATAEPMKVFQDFEITDEGGTILIATKAPAAAAATALPQSPISPTELMSGLTDLLGVKSMDELKPMIDDLMKGFKVSTKIESPLTVVDTNATTRDAATLSWVLRLDGGLEKLLAADPKSMVVSVRYKK